MSWSSKNGGDSPWGKNSNDDKESSFKKIAVVLTMMIFLTIFKIG